MLLQELHIEGFRSLKSVTWKPGHLNVLIGPNGGGKSNLLRALNLLRISANGGLRDAILRMGGMAPLVWDGQAKTIRFKLDLEVPFGKPSKLRYQFGLDRLGNTGGFEVGTDELLALDADQGSGEHRIIFRRPSRTKKSLTEQLAEQLIAPVIPAASEVMLYAMEGLQHPVAYILQQQMKGWSVHHDMRVDQDAELRQAAVTRSEKRVNPDGQNVIAVLHTLYENDRHFEDFIDNA